MPCSGLCSLDHTPLPTIFGYEDRTGYPVLVLDLLHKSSNQKTGQLFTNGPALLLVEAPHALFDWF
jgi:hypothetical protein